MAKYSAQTTTSHSKVHVDNVRDEAEDFYPDDIADIGSQQLDDFDLSQPHHYSSKTGQTGLARSGGRPRSRTLAATSSNPSSRESSPGGLTMSTGSSGSDGGKAAVNRPRELERTKFGFYGEGSLSQSDALDDYQVRVGVCVCVCVCVKERERASERA